MLARTVYRLCLIRRRWYSGHAHGNYSCFYEFFANYGKWSQQQEDERRNVSVTFVVEEEYQYRKACFILRRGRWTKVSSYNALLPEGTPRLSIIARDVLVCGPRITAQLMEYLEYTTNRTSYLFHNRLHWIAIPLFYDRLWIIYIASIISNKVFVLNIDWCWFSVNGGSIIADSAIYLSTWANIVLWSHGIYYLHIYSLHSFTHCY